MLRALHGALGSSLGWEQNGSLPQVSKIIEEDLDDLVHV